MKRKNLIILLILFLFPLNVFASGGFSVSSSGITLNPGQSKTINVTSNNAVGKLNVSTSNSGVASVSPSSLFIQTPGSSVQIKIVAKKVGTATISVVATSSFATMDEEILTGKTKNITVKVVEKKSSSTTNKSTTSDNKTTEEKKEVQNKSTNNNLKELKVEGYELTKVNNNNYKLIVPNNTSKIEVLAKAEDSKAKISGSGSHNLTVGNNNISIVVTAESGAKNTINLVVTRKDGYYLEDLNNLLNDSNLKDITITLNKDDNLTKQNLLDIKKSGKTITFNYCDENKIIKYSWIIDGSKIKDESSLKFNISNNNSQVKSISQYSNYVDGMYIKFDDTSKFPDNTMIKIFVGDKYNDGDLLNIYIYNDKDKKFELVKDKIKVKDGYIEIDLEQGAQYLITQSDLSLICNSNIENNTSLINIFLIISIIEFIAIIIVCILYYFKSKKM